MFERDPELERLLAPEKGEPPPPSDALRERLWRRLRASIDAQPGPTAVNGALVVVALLVGAALGGWLMRRSEPVAEPPAVAPVASPAQAVAGAPPVEAPVPAPVGGGSPVAPPGDAARAGARPVGSPAPAPFDVVGSRLDLRGAILDGKLARAAQVLAEHERRAPTDDVTEEREALLVRVAVHTGAPDAAHRLAAFRAKYPASLLVAQLEPPTTERAGAETGGGSAAPTPVVVASPPSEPSRHAGKACSLTGQLMFSTTDSWVSPSDVVVYVADKRRGARLPTPVRHEIAQVKQQFSPRTLIVQRADSVAFPNRDAPREHSVFSSDRTTVRISSTAKAEPEPATFTKEGGVRLQCDIHKYMRAWVMVVPDRSLATQAKDDGSWRIDDVPAGPHTLKVVEPNGATRELHVTACDDGPPVQVTLEGNEAPALKRFNGSPYSEYQQ